jgi:telomerase reverse transcriptase
VPSKTPSLVDLATPTAQVSTFCQVVVSKILPNGFWGEGDIYEHNKNMILKKIDEFIHLRRFESMSLHEVMQGMKVRDVQKSN